MRILTEGTTYPPSLNGQATFMANLAEGLAARGHDVAALFPDTQDSSGSQNGVRLEGVRSLDLSRIEPSTSSHPLTSGRRARQVLDDFRPDIVHIQDHYPMSVTLIREAKKRGFKTFGTNHFSPRHFRPYIPASTVFGPLVDKILWAWVLHLYRQLDFVTAPSQAAVNDLRAQGLGVPTLAVSCGVDLGHFHPDASVDRGACRAEYGLDPDRILFLSVGRLDPVKRVDTLVHAMGLLKRDDVQLAIAGKGPLLNQLRKLIQQLNPAARVHFLGRVPHDRLPRLLNSADVFCAAGDAETLSIASLEAMACGLPVLLANAGALPELATPGVNGYLFKPGDAVDAGSYMERLANERGRWKEMGLASLEKVKGHSLENTLDRYEALYEQLRTQVPALQTASPPSRRSPG